MALKTLSLQDWKNLQIRWLGLLRKHDQCGQPQKQKRLKTELYRYRVHIHQTFSRSKHGLGSSFCLD